MGSVTFLTVLVVPGGFGTDGLRGDEVAIGLDSPHSRNDVLDDGVCAGSLLLVAAGLLNGIGARPPRSG